MNKLTTRRFDLPATFACIFVIISWSVNPIFVKYLTYDTDVWTQNLLRYIVACLFWLPVLIWAISKGRVDKKIWYRSLIPVIANVIMQSLWVMAFYYIDPAFMNLLDKSSFLWIMVLSLFLFTEERVLLRSRRFWTSVILSITGIAGVMLFDKRFGTLQTTVGILLVLSAAILWSIYTVSVKIAFKDIDSRYGFSVISIYTVIGLFIPALFVGDLKQSFSLGAKPWIYIIVSSILSIALSHVFYYTAIKRIGAMIPALSLLATPFIVIVLSGIFFKERLNGWQLFSGILLLAGCALAIWSQEHLNPQKEDLNP